MKKFHFRLVIVLVILIIALLAIIFGHKTDLSVKKDLKPLKLNQTAQSRIVSSDCYGFLIPEAFSTTNQHGCSYNAYAESLKDNWINIDTYNEELNINQLKARFLDRKIDSSMQEIIEEKTIKLGDLNGVMLVDRYKSNGATYATILVALRPRWYLDGNSRIWGLELRGHYNSDEDKRIIDQIVTSWQWR